MIFLPRYMYSWREAQDYCRLKYTDLVAIHSAAEQRSVLRLVYTDTVWIGLFSDDWIWSDGATSFFRYWEVGKSLSLFNISTCAVMQMSENGMWDDSLCDRRLPFICYEGQFLCWFDCLLIWRWIKYCFFVSAYFWNVVLMIRVLCFNTHNSVFYDFYSYYA